LSLFELTDRPGASCAGSTISGRSCRARPCPEREAHRWRGNGYWKAQGASVIASKAAVADHRVRAEEDMIALTQFLGVGLDGTEPAYADVTFETDHRFGASAS